MVQTVKGSWRTFARHPLPGPRKPHSNLNCSAVSISSILHEDGVRGEPRHDVFTCKVIAHDLSKKPSIVGRDRRNRLICQTIEVRFLIHKERHNSYSSRHIGVLEMELYRRRRARTLTVVSENM
jgi:hypothetical protein